MAPWARLLILAHVREHATAEGCDLFTDGVDRAAVEDALPRSDDWDLAEFDDHVTTTESRRLF